MRFILQIVSVSMALFLSSCASLPGIKTPPQPMLQNGYFFTPLNERGWLIANRSVYVVDLVKPGEKVDESFAIRTMLTRLPPYKNHEEFVSLVKDGQAGDSNSKRFQILQQTTADYTTKGTDCVQTYMLSVDRGAVKKSSNPENMLLEGVVLTCAYPYDKRVGISIFYSQRYYQGHRDPSLLEKAATLFESVTFRPPELLFLEPEGIEGTPSGKFSLLCTQLLQKASTTSAQPIQVSQGDSAPDPVGRLASMGISIRRNGSIKETGSYVLFRKGKDNSYVMTEVKPYYIEPDRHENAEVLFVSSALDTIYPAFALYKFSEAREAFLCSLGPQAVTGLDTSDRNLYNPCDSSLTSSTNVGASIIANTALTVLSGGVNVLTGSATTFVDTDKEKVARLVVNSKLLNCIIEATNAAKAMPGNQNQTHTGNW